jgi:serine/threonine-protein kinase
LTISVVIADDAALLRAGIVRLLADEGMRVVGEAGDASRLLDLVDEHAPDVAVVDVRMPPDHSTEGIDAAIRIRSEHPKTGVLLMSQYVETEHAMELLSGSTGGIGYLLKDRVGHVEDFVSAVRRVANGETAMDPDLVQSILRRPHRGHRPQDDLTHRETEVLSLMAEGLSNRAIGGKLFLTERTVETHIRSIFQKLGLSPEPDVHRRVLAVLAYLRSSATPVLTPDTGGSAG